MATATAVTEIRPHKGPQERFLSSAADLAIYGGAAGGGKTWAILMEPLRHVGNPDFKAVVFRRTYPEITNAGGLWDESWQLYPLLGAEARMTDLQWSFPSGARVEFGHLQHETDKRKWQGSQIPLIAFDELTHFTESQFFYMLSRNRSTSGVRPYVRATCNPDADSWVAGLVAWWIDQETGYAIPERAGVVRWFARVHGNLEWADDPRELRRLYPDQEPKSLAFIPARLEDNPTLMEADPSYRANLQALPFVERERLLGGNWRVHATEGAYWGEHPEYFDKRIWAEVWPEAFEVAAVFIDPSLGRTAHSDFSAIVFVGLAGGRLWVDADIRRRPAEQLVDDGIAFYLAHRPDVFGVEDNAFQSLFGPMFQRACADRRIPPLPLRMLHNHESKEDVRIPRLGPRLAADQFRFRDTPGCRELLRQLRGFGLPGVKKDGPDALEGCCRMLVEMSADAALYADADAEYAAV